jgi:hypothetical protein
MRTTLEMSPILLPAGIAAKEFSPTDRERLVAILKGEPVDRIPWIPRILLW